jgi:short-subunit dehydrogenase
VGLMNQSDWFLSLPSARRDSASSAATIRSGRNYSHHPISGASRSAKNMVAELRRVNSRMSCVATADMVPPGENLSWRSEVARLPQNYLISNVNAGSISQKSAGCGRPANSQASRTQPANHPQAMKKIFLTGASSGIGRAVAHALVAQGHEVWGTSREPTRISTSPRMHAVRLDLSDPHSIDEGFRVALEEAGGFDVVINNAGSGHFGPANFVSDENLLHYFQVLVLAHVRIMRLAFAAMRSQERGLIINVTSLASRLPVPFMAAYNAAKAAMAAFTMSLQLELSEENIRIIDLQPSDICTGFNDAVEKNEMEDPRVAKAWSVVDRNMRTAPKPAIVAERVLDLFNQTNPPPRVTIGDFFQSRIAPLIFRFLPQRLRVWALKKYYGI